MADEPNNGPIVIVSRDGARAFSEPVFIMKIGDCYYMSLALWSYEASKAATPQQEQGVQQVAEAFASGQRVDCVMITDRHELYHATGTGPGHIQ